MKLKRKYPLTQAEKDEVRDKQAEAMAKLPLVEQYRQVIRELNAQRNGR